MDVKKYRRRLPHILVPGSLYFLTFRLAPQQGHSLAEEERSALSAHIGRAGPGHCRAFVIMPDHVHLLYQSVAEEDLRKTLPALKSSSAHSLAHRFGRCAPIWQDETYDHIVRNEKEMLETWKYIEANPIRRGLASHPCEYPWSSAFCSALGTGDAAGGGRATEKLP